MVSQWALCCEEPKWVRPSSLQDEAIRKQAVGQLFDSVSHGVRHMPAYEHQISVEDRWNIILYVRLAAEPERHAGRRAAERA